MKTVKTVKIKQHFHKDTLEKTTEKRRKKVFDVAISEFAKNGYYGTSINTIAKKSEVSIGALYKYFESKEDLFLSIVNKLHMELEDAVRTIMESKQSGIKIIENMFIMVKDETIKFPKKSQIYHYATTQPMEHMFKKVLGELEPLTVQAIKYALNKIKEEKNIDFDENIVSFIIDNLLITYRMSFSSNYYKDRMILYLGKSDKDGYDDLIKLTMEYIERMILGKTFV